MTSCAQQSIAYCPSASQAFGDAVVRKAGLPSPRCNTLRATIMCQIAYSTAICGLLLSCSPSTILGSIVSIVVDAVEFQSIGDFTHVDQKVLKAIPAVTNDDAPTTVVGIVGVGRTITSTPHLCPCAMGACMRHSMSGLCFSTGSCNFSIEATAASSLSVLQSGRTFGYKCAAMTPTVPHGGWATIGCSAKYQQTRVLISGKVMCFGHGSYKHNSGVV